MLANIPLFAGQDAADLDALLARAHTKSVGRNTVIFQEGDDSDALYIIEAGRVKVFLSDDNGREIILNTLGPREYFGEMALIDDVPRSASVMTIDACTFKVLSRQDFAECLERHPRIALNLVKELSRRLRKLTDSVKSLALMDVYGRVAKTLLGLAQQVDGKLVIDQRLTQQDIANRIGASREMVSRILKDLTTGGYITLEDRRIVIHEKLPPGW